MDTTARSHPGAQVGPKRGGVVTRAAGERILCRALPASSLVPTGVRESGGKGKDRKKILSTTVLESTAVEQGGWGERTCNLPKRPTTKMCQDKQMEEHWGVKGKAGGNYLCAEKKERCTWGETPFSSPKASQKGNCPSGTEKVSQEDRNARGRV